MSLGPEFREGCECGFDATGNRHQPSKWCPVHSPQHPDNVFKEWAKKAAFEIANAMWHPSDGHDAGKDYAAQKIYDILKQMPPR